MAFSWTQKRSQKSPWHARPRKETAPPTPPPPLGELIRTLRVTDVEHSAKRLAPLAQIDNVRTVTSFNWVDKPGSGPAILIPGKPPLWTPQSDPVPLKEDSGTYYRDKNAARYPRHPLEPAVVAALRADPAIPAEVDLFACGSTLGNLLRFVRGEDRAFRMLAYLVRDTVFLVRRENSPTELIPDVRGYGHTFPEANTTWEPDVKGSASHQRLVRYTFGGLDMIIRFEADGYIRPPPPGPSHTATTTAPSIPDPKPTTTDTDLITALETTTITPPTPPPQSTPQPQPLQITTSPTTPPIPHAALFELKTRGIGTRHTRNHLAEELPRLWVSQLPTFILAYHKRGLFCREDTEIRDVRADVKAWEREHARELAVLAGVVGWVREFVISCGVEGGGEGGEGVEICCAGDGVLEVRRRLGDAGEVLSCGVRGEWEEGGEKGSEKGSEKGGEEKVEKEREKGDESDEKGLGEVEWDDGEENDFTACDEACGYCGKCTY